MKKLTKFFNTLKGRLKIYKKKNLIFGTISFIEMHKIKFYFILFSKFYDFYSLIYII